RRPPLEPPLFPYTTLFRSRRPREVPLVAAEHPRQHALLHASRSTCASSVADRPHGHPRFDLLAAVADIGGRGILLDVDDDERGEDRKSTRLNSSHVKISYA